MTYASEATYPDTMPILLVDNPNSVVHGTYINAAGGIEYTRSDLIPAMLAQARAEGREQGLREAAAHVGVRVGRHGTGFTQNCQCGMCNARREGHVFILDLLDTPPPDAEEGGE